MRAVVYKGVSEVAVMEVPAPVLVEPTDVLVKVTVSSICGSDLHTLHGKMPGVLPGNTIGHEFTGLITEVGNGVKSFAPGDRVLGPAAVWCGKCRACLSGNSQLCDNRGVFGCGPRFGDLGGAQADYVRVPYADTVLKKIPATLSDEKALFAGDILPTAYTAVAGIARHNPGVKEGDTLAVFGAGPVGLCAVATAKLRNPARIIAVDMVKERLETAKALGADVVIDASEKDAGKIIKELTGGWGADYVIEAVGHPATLTAALSCASPSSVCSVVGVFERPVEIALNKLIGKNISLEVGLGDLGHMEEMLGLLESGRLDLSLLATHRLELGDAPKGYEIFDKRAEGVLKVLLFSDS